MYLTVSRRPLEYALSLLTKVAAPKSSLPILSQVHCEAIRGSLVLTTTDLDIALRYRLEAQVQREGKVCVPAKLLWDLVKCEPGSYLNLRHDSAQPLAISSFGEWGEESHTRLKVMPAGDFPSFPPSGKETMLNLKVGMLTNAITSIAPMACKSAQYDRGAVLSHVLFSHQKGRLQVIAGDSYSLAQMILPGREERQDFQVLVERESLLKVGKMLPKEGSVQLAFGEGILRFITEGLTILTHIRQDAYPDHQDILSGTPTTTIEVDRAKLLKAIKRLGKLSEGKERYGDLYDAQVETIGPTLVLSSRRKKEEVDATQVELPATVRGAHLLYSFKVSFLASILEKMTGVGTVVLEVIGEKEAIRLHPLIPSGLLSIMKAEDATKVETKEEQNTSKTVRSMV